MLTTAAQTLKAGTRIEFYGTPAIGGFPGVAPERAKIVRWTKVNGPLPNHISPGNGGWHIVQFDNGGQLCAHENRFRVISNAKAR